MPRNTDLEENLLTLQLFESHKKNILATARALYGHHKSFDIVLGFRLLNPTSTTSPPSISPTANPRPALHAAILVEFVEPQGTRWILRGEEVSSIGEAVASLQQMLGQTALVWMARCRGGGAKGRPQVQAQALIQRKAASEVEEGEAEDGESRGCDEERERRGS